MRIHERIHPVWTYFEEKLFATGRGLKFVSEIDSNVEYCFAIRTKDWLYYYIKYTVNTWDAESSWNS